MRSPSLFLWLLTGQFIGLVTNLSAADISCYLRGAKTSGVPYVEKFFGAFAQLPKETQAPILRLDDQRIEFLRELDPYHPGLRTSPWMRKYKDAKGNERKVFGLNEFSARDLHDPKNVRKRLEQLCPQAFSGAPERVQKLCVESHFMRIEEGDGSLKAYAEKNMAKIQAHADKPPSMTETWADNMAGETFEYNSLQDGNMKWGPYPYLPVMTLFRNFGNLQTVSVCNSQAVAGLLFPIDENGKSQFYLAPLRRMASRPIDDDVLSPYHFIFGSHTSSSDWNKDWEANIGAPLCVNGVPLEQAVQSLESQQLAQKDRGI